MGSLGHSFTTDRDGTVTGRGRVITRGADAKGHWQSPQNGLKGSFGRLVAITYSPGRMSNGTVPLLFRDSTRLYLGPMTHS